MRVAEYPGKWQSSHRRLDPKFECTSTAQVDRWQIPIGRAGRPVFPGVLQRLGNAWKIDADEVGVVN